ncbi:DUF305 domain-containing protein [Actinoplanes sp. L3-i22]|uniref:DUF305 domain-containing protein n=1 Tax=Actinoplanes sp. L3-i22 TaxID=2836373 RepID=UPI001C74C9F8|nr:DUF305 domain-containing protein [Actinoplanes sp. L3-i22]BCY12136.1 hypothetical protein L3i22_072240 [Actinoplanes sp. L3-i22]
MKANPRPVVLAIAVGLLTVTGCGAASPAGPSPAPGATSPAAPAAAGAAARSASGAALGPAFGGTDLAWIEINIAMDEELLPLLELTPANSSSAAMKKVSAQVKTFTTEELGTLRQLHDEAGLPAENPHKGMPMPGMVTPALLASAGAQRGAAFDTVLAKSLREHLNQSHQLATSEQSAGAESRTKALAARILETRAAALEALQKDF